MRPGAICVILAFFEPRSAGTGRLSPTVLLRCRAATELTDDCSLCTLRESEHGRLRRNDALSWSNRPREPASGRFRSQRRSVSGDVARSLRSTACSSCARPRVVVDPARLWYMPLDVAVVRPQRIDLAVRCRSSAVPPAGPSAYNGTRRWCVPAPVVCRLSRRARP